MVTLEARVEALEQEGAQMRNECKEFHQAQVRVLNSLRETQIEHGETLKEHSGILNEQGEILKEHSGILKEHSGILKEHSGILKEHSGILKEQGEILKEHSGILKEHGRLLHEVKVGMTDIVQSLDYLIKQQGQSQS